MNCIHPNLKPTSNDTSREEFFCPDCGARYKKQASTDERNKEYIEFWKASALAFLSTGNTTKEHGGYSDAACGVADKMVIKFKNKFG